MKILILLTCLFAVNITLAENCPTVKNIKKGKFYEWLPLYSPDDEPASKELIQEFEQSIQPFYTAEWSEDYNYGHARCYYYSDVEVSLAKEMPQPTSKHWHWHGTVDQCQASNVKKCPF